MTTAPLPALLGLLDCLLTRLAVIALPWSNRSQHDAWQQGYREGVRDGYLRRDLRLPQ